MSSKASARDVRDAFGRMGMNDTQTVPGNAMCIHAHFRVGVASVFPPHAQLRWLSSGVDMPLERATVHAPRDLDPLLARRQGLSASSAGCLLHNLHPQKRRKTEEQTAHDNCDCCQDVNNPWPGKCGTGKGQLPRNSCGASQLVAVIPSKDGHLHQWSPAFTWLSCPCRPDPNLD